MARGIYPGARVRLIPAGSNDPPITPRVAILHVAVSLAASLYSFFRYRSGGIESHFYVRRSGVVEQYRNIFRQADANYHANDFAVSIETAGFGPGWWNRKQKRAIEDLLLWLHEETSGGIPLKVCDGPYGSGVGHHTMWGAPSSWTPVAKSCPGPNRKRQFRRWLTPWLNSNPNQEDDMPYLDWPKKDREALADDVAKAVAKRNIPVLKMPLQRVIRKIFKRSGK